MLANPLPPTLGNAGGLRYTQHTSGRWGAQDKAMLQLTEQFDEYRRLHRDCGNVVAPPPPPPPDPSAQQQVERLQVRRP
jgi:hypothetical protein